MTTTSVDRRVCIAPPNTSPMTAYRNLGCRCYTCCAVTSAYERDRVAAIKAGTWRPWVDAAPVLAHLEQLREQGVGYQRIAKAANLPEPLVVRYFNRYRAVPKRIRPEAAEALLAVTAHAALSAGRLIPSFGTRRRAQALAAIGWSLTEQATRAGYLRSPYRTTLHNPRLHVTFAAAVADLYDRLSGTAGPSELSRRYAERRGWPPPLAWDDDIDDPEATPRGVRRIAFKSKTDREKVA